MVNKIIFNKTNKLLVAVVLVLSCNSLLGYKLLVINDSKDAAIKFYKGDSTKDIKIIPGFAVYNNDIGAKEKLYYNRGGEDFTFGSVEIARNFGDLFLDNLIANDYVAVRFLEDTGYIVTIIKENQATGNSLGRRFKCEHNKVLGVRYSTEVKPLTGKAGQFNIKNVAAGTFFTFAREKLLEINNGMIELLGSSVKRDKKDYEQIFNRTSKLINELNTHRDAKEVMGGDIKFHAFNQLYQQNKRLQEIKQSKDKIAEQKRQLRK